MILLYLRIILFTPTPLPPLLQYSPPSPPGPTYRYISIIHPIQWGILYNNPDCRNIHNNDFSQKGLKKTRKGQYRHNFKWPTSLSLSNMQAYVRWSTLYRPSVKQKLRRYSPFSSWKLIILYLWFLFLKLTLCSRDKEGKWREKGTLLYRTYNPLNTMSKQINSAHCEYRDQTIGIMQYPTQQ